MKVWKSGRRVRLCRKISGKGIKVEMPKIEENWWRQDWVSEGKKKKKEGQGTEGIYTVILDFSRTSEKECWQVLVGKSLIVEGPITFCQRI